VHDVSRSKAGALGVGGKLESGALRVGTKVMLLPGGEVGAVKSIEVNGQVRGAQGAWGGSEGARLQHGHVRAAPGSTPARSAPRLNPWRPPAPPRPSSPRRSRAPATAPTSR
jgi:hypothetical protein